MRISRAVTFSFLTFSSFVTTLVTAADTTTKNNDASSSSLSAVVVTEGGGQKNTAGAIPSAKFNVASPTLPIEKQQQGGPPPPPPHVIALDLATGNWKAQATKAFVTSGIAAAMEVLCAPPSKKFVSSAEIAKKAGLHPDSTYRLLRFLSTLDVCIEGGNRDFALGPVGEVLTPNHPQSVANLVVWEADLTPALVWDKLPRFLETNDKATPDALGGVDSIWTYLSQHPDTLAIFSRAMTGYSNEEAMFLSNPALSPTFDLSQFEVICDLGAAEGRLSKALASRFPNTKNFILADLPEVVGRLDPAELPSNFSIEPTNFLKEVPPVAEAYLLKHIIHDWSDEESKSIFDRIRTANPDATVFVIEFGPMPGPNVPHLAKGFDIHMGVIAKGAERTQEEYDTLFEKSGYERINTHFLAGGNYPLYVQELKAIPTMTA